MSAWPSINWIVRMASRQGPALRAVPEGFGLDVDCAQGAVGVRRRLPNDLASLLN